MMSEEQETLDRNFRSAYYKSLGVRGSEKSITHLEQLLRAEIFDVKKLKSFCLKHALTVFYRPLVWKIILSVVPVYADKDTRSFVEEQKKIEFQDLKHALYVMGRLEQVISEGVSVGVASDVMSTSASTGLSTSSTSCQSSSPDTRHTPTSSQLLAPPALPSLSSHLTSTATTTTTHRNHVSSTPVPIKSQHNGISPLSSTNSSTPKAGLHDSTELSSRQGVPEHRPLPQLPPATPRDFVTIFLLETKRLLSSSINQMKQERQLNTMAIAEAFFLLFDDEPEDCRYWLFSNFQKKLESYLATIEEMHDHFHQLLEDIDCTLLEHINDLEAHEDIVHVIIEKWFFQCFAKDLPESCIESIWDRVIGGSCVILVYLAVAILLSFKRKILGFSHAAQLQQLLNKIPKENFGMIVSQAIQLWESHGCPLLPSSMSKPDAELSQDELYEIEDYT